MVNSQLVIEPGDAATTVPVELRTSHVDTPTSKAQSDSWTWTLALPVGAPGTAVTWTANGTKYADTVSFSLSPLGATVHVVAADGHKELESVMPQSFGVNPANSVVDVPGVPVSFTACPTWNIAVQVGGQSIPAGVDVTVPVAPFGSCNVTVNGTVEVAGVVGDGVVGEPGVNSSVCPFDAITINGTATSDVVSLVVRGVMSSSRGHVPASQPMGIVGSFSHEPSNADEPMS
jgi:hypothetical protein